MKNVVMYYITLICILYAVSYISVSCASCVLMAIIVVQAYRCILKY